MVFCSIASAIANMKSAKRAGKIMGVTVATFLVTAAIAGVLKYRRILEFNSLTVSRFKNTYQSVMNNSKYDQYVKKMF